MLKIKFEERNDQELKEYIYSIISEHTAINHPMFDFIKNQIDSGNFTDKQYSFFRHIMFSRVYLTIPSITVALKAAIIKEDFESIETCFQNLSDELSFNSDNGGNLGRSHPRLMEEAFNFIGNVVFKLKDTSLSQSFQTPLLSTEIIYHSTILKLYKEHPLTVSLAQEISSGGIISNNKPGMMEQLYKIFFTFYKNNADKINIEKFKIRILPYFSAHLAIDHNFQIEHNGTGIEFQHGERAIKDYLRNKNSIAEIKKDIPYLLAFLDAQKYLFDCSLEYLKK